VKAVLIDCGKIERLAADIYRRLASHREFCDEVRATFARLAQDELDHATQLDMALQFPEEKNGMIKRISGEKIVEGLEKARRIAQDIETHSRSEEAALKMAIDLENSFVKVHLDNAIHFSEPRVAELFKHLGRGDAAHLETLKQCLSWWHSQRQP